MHDKNCPQETGAQQPTTGSSAIFRKLHDQCSHTMEMSLLGDNQKQLGEAYLFAGDLDTWRATLDGQMEARLIETASCEYVLAALNICQGQYRNGFKGLRLVLELCLQSTHLSANLVLRAEWLKGEKDTIWATLVDHEDGPLSDRSCRGFFPELSEHVPHFRQLAKTIYRELSECIHGNVPNHIPLPTSLTFSQDTFDLWLSKAKSVRLVAQFAFTLRYMNDLSFSKREPLEAAVTDQLGHIAAIRSAFEQGA